MEIIQKIIVTSMRPWRTVFPNLVKTSSLVLIISSVVKKL